MELIIDNIDTRIDKLKNDIDNHTKELEKMRKELNKLNIYKTGERNYNNKDMLTVREIEVLNALQQGKSNQEIANSLYISVNTVKKHVGNIMSKTGAERRTQLIFEKNELL